MSPCSACGQNTKTIAGRCPNCGAAKKALPFRANYQGTASNEDLFWIAVLVVPCLAALVLFALLLPGLLVYVGMVVVAVAVVAWLIRAITGDT